MTQLTIERKLDEILKICRTIRWCVLLTWAAVVLPGATMFLLKVLR